MSKIRTYESNSQQSKVIWKQQQCCSWCQRYELMRAIHNLPSKITTAEMVVPDVKDTNLWEQFTTEICKGCYHSLLFLMSKIRTYESNSQPIEFSVGSNLVVPDVKDTNLWEQFTTTSSMIWTRILLFLMSKIRTYESNSQPSIVSVAGCLSCSWCQRYELMRAIHNLLLRTSHRIRVVPDVKDTNLWEQFTTIEVVLPNPQPLFLMSKIRTYESNSQHDCHNW